MAFQIRPFDVTIPAGTIIANPYVASLAMPPYQVDRIDWRVPPGPSGQMGWYLAMGGVQVIPYANGDFVTADDENDSWRLTDLPTSGAWQLVGYNLGNYNHTVYLRFFLSQPPGLVSAAQPVLILQPSSALSS